MTSEQQAGDDARVKRLLVLDDQRKALEAQVDAIKKERGELEDALVKEWRLAGKQNVRIDGRTVYLRRDVYVSAAKDATGAPRTAAVIEALRLLGMDEFITDAYSASRLAGWVREQPLDESTLLPTVPPVLAGCIKVSEEYSLRNTK